MTKNLLRVADCEVDNYGEPTSLKVYPKEPMRIFVTGDWHVPFCDETAFRLMVKICRMVAPHLIVLNGDIIDCFSISRFSTDPKRKLMLADELEEAKRKLGEFVKAVRPFHPTIVYLEGNHEERLRRYLWTKAPELSVLECMDIPFLLSLPAMKILYLRAKHVPTSLSQDVLPIIRIGHKPALYITHGSHIRSGSNTINIARSVFLRVLVNMVISHWHRADVYIQPDYDGKLSGVWVVPCLALPRPHYDAGRIWGQGCATISVAPDGFFKVDILPFIRKNGQLICFVEGKSVTEDVEVTANANSGQADADESEAV